MAFEKKTWVDRQSEYPNRRTLTATGNDGEYDVSRSEGIVIAEGDKLDAENLNDLEKRIADGFDNVDAGVTVDFDSAEESGQPTTVNADTLGGQLPSFYDNRPVLLWINADTSSDFEPQTISLDLSEYRLCLIEFLLGKGGNVSQHEICSVGNQTRIIVGLDAGNANKALVRGAVTTTTSVQFTDAQSISGTTIATANNVLIPYKIFGIK